MAQLPAQHLGRLILPMGLLAILCGVIFGALAGLLLVVPDMTSGSTDYFVTESWGVFFAYTLWLMMYGAVVGGLVSILPGLGALIALALKDHKSPYSDGKKQSVDAAIGASIGALLPALALATLYGGDGTGWGWVFALAFVGLCCGIALVATGGLLRCLDKRDAVVR